MYKIETKFEAANSWLIDNSKRAPFSHSFEWEEILSREGREIERLTVFDDTEPVAMALVQYYRIPFGWKYAFCPKGPIIIQKSNLAYRQAGAESQKIFEIFFTYLKEKKCIFFRFEPAEDLHITNNKLLKTIDVNPRATMILDLRKTPDELLKSMHQKTRYNINLSQKKDLRISDQKDADLFMRLMRQTARRDKFRLHEERHYHEIIFSPLSYQLTVFLKEIPIASAVFVGFGNTFTYVFGASDYEHRALMAPHLIQWEGIKLAQRFGYRYYDFFGVAPRLGLRTLDSGFQNENENYEYDQKHQYAGVTRFKQGFGGEYHEEQGTYDLIISPWQYKLYQVFRAIRRII